MVRKELSGKMVKITVSVPEEIAEGIKKMVLLKKLSKEKLLRLWIEEGLERDELRFERLLILADMSEDLDEQTCRLLAKLRTKYFDETSDGDRGLDSYLIKSPVRHGKYGNTMYVIK